MNQTVINVEGLSKQYQIGALRERYQTLRDTLTDAIAAPFRAIITSQQRSNGRSVAKQNGDRTVWALKDVSFSVQQGEVTGVIGRNGAGKTTLLKILSRITEPTRGSALINGRVGSLLEVGTGFHPELTGRENIFLNGAILGMKRNEIAEKFDEIVEFAEIAKFIDTPVKRYSTGMYLRLAFSVAAHLQPDILLIDEVLAVGDLAFQKKCLGKMEQAATQGRTVLFVSHNLAAIKEMCQSCLVLNNGQLEYNGPVVQALAHYMQSVSDRDWNSDPLTTTAWSEVSVEGQTPRLLEPMRNEAPFAVEGVLHVAEDFRKARLFCLISNSDGHGVLHHVINHDQFSSNGLQAGMYQIRVEFPPLWLMPDAYSLHFKVIGWTKSGVEKRHLSERVILDMKDVTGQSHSKVRAVIVPPLRWHIKEAQSTPAS